MRSDGLLPYEFEEEPTKSRIMGRAGLLVYTDLACVLGLPNAADQEIGACGDQGWMDRHHVLSLILLNIAGGESVEDIRQLEADPGLCEILREAERYGLSKPERKMLDKRFRKGRDRTFPSETRLYEYLNLFHNAQEEAKRVEGKAFIPEKNRYLLGLGEVNRRLVGDVQRHIKETTATLDIDATLQETTKKEALYCYDGCKAYQPINVYWAETGMIAHSEFRDGNVPAGYEVKRILKESLDYLPEGIEKIDVRMDSAGYQHDVLRFCATGDEGKRPVIEFTVSNDMTAEFRKAALEVGDEEWKPLYRKRGKKMAGSGQEWAEVVYVPNAIGHSMNDPEYRYIAIREPLPQGVLPGMDDGKTEMSLPFATITWGNRAYRIKGIVTNKEGDGADIIRWHYARCGKSEGAHSVMKRDLAGGRMPSGKFGANAAWWGIMILAYNLHAAMILLALPGPLLKKRLKALRFALIDVPARIVEHGRRMFVRLAGNNPALFWLMEMRRKISKLAPSPA